MTNPWGRAPLKPQPRHLSDTIMEYYCSLIDIKSGGECARNVKGYLKQAYHILCWILQLLFNLEYFNSMPPNNTTVCLPEILNHAGWSRGLFPDNTDGPLPEPMLTYQQYLMMNNIYNFYLHIWNIHNEEQVFLHRLWK